MSSSHIAQKIPGKFVEFTYWHRRPKCGIMKG